MVKFKSCEMLKPLFENPVQYWDSNDFNLKMNET